MSLTPQQIQARETFHQLENPSWKYGLGMVFAPKINWDELLVQLQQSPPGKITVTADPAIRVYRWAELDEEKREYLQKLVSASENKMLALHYAALKEVIFIHVPAHYHSTSPLYINSQQLSPTAEQIVVVAGKNAAAMILETSTSTAYKSQVVQLFLEENAQLTYCSSSSHNSSTTSTTFTTKRASVAHDAMVTWIDVISGNSVQQLAIQSHLTQPGAMAKTYTAFSGSHTNLYDINIESFHQAAATKSIMKAKGVLEGSAKATYRGTIRIGKNAPDSVGEQRSDALLLGENAHCDALPILEVENDDVVCSHGSTIGPIDEEQLYYLQSRGIDARAARQIIIAGFLEPIVKEIPEEKIREQWREAFRHEISP